MLKNFGKTPAICGQASHRPPAPFFVPLFAIIQHLTHTTCPDAALIWWSNPFRASKISKQAESAFQIWKAAAMEDRIWFPGRKRLFLKNEQKYRRASGERFQYHSKHGKTFQRCVPTGTGAQFLVISTLLWKATENSGNVVQKCHAQKPVEPSFSTR